MRISNTFNTEKSEIICKYINMKNDNKEEISKPKTLIRSKDNLLSLLENIN